MLKYHIQTIQISTATPTITFSNIPQIYSDLLIVVSDRSDRSGAVNDAVMLRCNGTNVTGRRLFGSGSSATSTADFAGINVAGNATANTFSNMAFYISNYSSSTTIKLVSLEAVGENNDTLAYQSIAAGLFNSTSPVTSIVLYQETGTNFVQHSSASLYGIKRGSDGKTEVASGGTITTSGGYTIHTFNSSGTFVANRDMDVEYLVIGGGGGGGAQHGGGGGAGGYRTSVIGATSGGGSFAEPTLRVATGTSYTVTVGAGGAGALATATNGGGTVGTPGASSVFGNVVSLGGGGGSSWFTGKPALTGGSGGGGSGGNSGTPTGAAGTSGQGFAGGNGVSPESAGGGGGAGAIGGNGTIQTVGGAGGNGVSSSITGSAVTRAGGGGGGVYVPSGTATGGSGGSGGGGNGGWADGAGTQRAAPTSGTTNTGSGGGGNGTFNTNAGNGGSGVVIIRYLTPA